MTPCKNEQNNLPNLLNSIERQTIKPVLWTIVDDGSTDDSVKIINEYEPKYKWIKCIKSKFINANKKERDLGFHYAEIVNQGFDFAIDYCKNRSINYCYLSILDADMSLESTYFEGLIKQFEIDESLGIAGGGIKYKVGDSFIQSKGNPNEPSGGNILIRRKCFEDCGGIPISRSCDSVLKVKARLKGWKTRRFEEYLAIEGRDVSSANGYWKGYTMEGKSAYYRNLHPVHVFARSLKLLLRYPYYIPVPYLTGYLADFISNKPKIEDNEIKLYYWTKWKNIFRS